MTAQHCQSCAGELLTDGTTIATACPYCGNTAIITKTVTDALKPDFVIPFKLDRAAAKEKLAEFYKKKPLLPKCFKQNSQIDKIAGAYVPFWLYDADTASTAVYDATRTRTWTTGDMRHTRTEHYMVSRAADLSFEKIPVDGSAKQCGTTMESIEPYGCNELQPFSMAFLSGYLADKHDVDFAAARPRIDARINASTEKRLRATVSGYASVKRKSLSVKVKESKINYALLPVWFLNTSWNGSTYNFTMNGQTGKAAGTLPVDKKKAAGIFAAIFAVLSAIIIGIGLLAKLGGPATVVIVALIIGAIAAAATIGIMMSKMKTIRQKPAACDYERGFKLTNSTDRFLYATTRSVRIPTANSGNRGGMSVGRR
jgi:hypothetical protein